MFDTARFQMNIRGVSVTWGNHDLKVTRESRRSERWHEPATRDKRETKGPIPTGGSTALVQFPQTHSLMDRAHWQLSRGTEAELRGLAGHEPAPSAVGRSPASKIDLQLHCYWLCQEGGQLGVSSMRDTVQECITVPQ